MPSIQDQLSGAAAELLMRLFESDYLTIHQEIQLNDEDLLHLSSLTLHQQRYLIRHAHQFISVAFDVKALRRKLLDIESMNAERKLEDRYLLQSAPLALMRRLFGMHASEFSRRRQLLNLGGSGTGRPKACKEGTEHHIWYQWQSHEDMEERERFLAVAEDTGENLLTIWAGLREHIDN